jgi:hypothetical protein
MISGSNDSPSIGTFIFKGLFMREVLNLGATGNRCERLQV